MNWNLSIDASEFMKNYMITHLTKVYNLISIHSWQAEISHSGLVWFQLLFLKMLMTSDFLPTDPADRFFSLSSAVGSWVFF